MAKLCCIFEPQGERSDEGLLRKQETFFFWKKFGTRSLSEPPGPASANLLIRAGSLFSLNKFDGLL